MAQNTTLAYQYPGIRRCGGILALAAVTAVVSVGPPALAQCEIAGLWASDAGFEHYFGWDVTASDDLSTLMVSATGHDFFRGAVYYYAFDAETSQWAETAILTAPKPTPIAKFGKAVSLSGDGKTLLVAEVLGDNDGGNDAGAAYVFTFDTEKLRWSAAAQLTASDAIPGRALGLDAALTPDGRTAVVGSADDDGEEPYNGALYVFDRPAGGWRSATENAKLKPSDGMDLDFFARSVAISNDGMTLVSGAQFQDEGAFQAGAAYVFTRDESGWVEQQKLLGQPPLEGAEMGNAVAISGDGRTILLGANSDDEFITSAGAAHVFVLVGGTWTQQAKLIASDAGIQHHFGWSVDLSDDGHTALIGTIASGGAYLFKRRGSLWTEQMKLTSYDNNVLTHGRSVFLSSDTNTAVLGASNSMINGEFWYGSARVFDLTSECLGDLDGDTIVGASDLLILLSAWGPCDECFACGADLDDDCTVGASDLLILLANWG